MVGSSVCCDFWPRCLGDLPSGCRERCADAYRRLADRATYCDPGPSADGGCSNEPSDLSQRQWLTSQLKFDAVIAHRVIFVGSFGGCSASEVVAVGALGSDGRYLFTNKIRRRYLVCCDGYLGLVGRAYAQPACHDGYWCCNHCGCGCDDPAH